MNNRTLVASDTFARADGALGSNWTQLRPYNGTISIHSHYAVGVSVNGLTNAAADWAGAGSIGNDQYSKTAIAGLDYQSFNYGMGVVCRASGSDNTSNYYGLYIACDSGSSFYKTCNPPGVTSNFAVKFAG